MATAAKKAILELIPCDGDEAVSRLCCTFVMHNEDHTLGNALRYIVSQNSNVEFCGYSVPHPSESKILFRIQVRENAPSNVSAISVLRQGLTELSELCDHVTSTFQSAVQKYEGSQMSVDNQ